MSDPEPTVFVVDDDKAIRDVLSSMIGSAGLKVETFASAQDFLNVYVDARPGCLVLDVNMPVMNGLDLQDVLIERNLRLPVILISGSGNVPTVVRGMYAGAIDFLEKPFKVQALLDRIRQAFEIQARQQLEFQQIRTWASRYATLTPRERDVMQHLCTGMTGKEIAAQLGITYKTVEKFRGNLMRKMQARNVIELLRMAESCGCATTDHDVPAPPRK